MLQDLLQDLRFGFRMLRRNPGFSLLAILCLTLGIGANAAVFSWIEGVALRPFPGVAHQETLVAVAGTRPAGDKGAIGSGYTDVSLPDFKDFQRSCNLIESFIVDRIMATTLNIGDRAERVAGTIASSNYFDALGVRPFLGRGFTPDEDSGRNAHPVVVISYWIWKERFHSDPAILGKTQMLNGLPHTIVGVTPEGFFGTFVGYPMQLWVPMSMQELFNPGGYKLEDRAATWIEGFARLKPGVTIDQAQEQISTVAKRLENDYLATNRGRGIKLLPLWKDPFNQAGELLPTLEITFAVVFLVLLIACANVSSLLLVRAFARRHEMTIRFALGSKRGRLLKQVFTEGLILSTLAAIGGLIVAYLCRNLLVLFFPGQGGITINLRGQMDWRVLLFSGGICLVSTMLFAIIPAVQTGKIDLAAALKSESGSVFGGHGKSRIRSGLVLVQVSLSFILLVGAVLLIQSLQRTRTADPGFSTDNVLTTIIDLTATGYDIPRAKVFYDNLVDRVQALPGVESAAIARIRPFSYAPYLSAPIAVDNYHPAINEQPMAEYNQVSPGYFTTMGISLMSGRDFTRNDNETASPVAIVNQKMVEQYWNGVDPVGKRLQVKGQSMQVVGVARNSKYQTFSEAPKPFFYVPLRQSFATRSTLNIRTSRDPEAISAALYREIQALDDNLAPAEVISLREHVNRSALSSQNVAVALLSIFGGLALLLAAVGLYGVMSYAVSQNTRELGLRMAFGARTSDLIRLVMSHGLALTIGGVFVGAVAALLLTRQIASLLYKVNPRDPFAFGLALVVMTIISMSACFVPAWRASRTDPVRALRD
ncbi:MAG TPA: ABC transporter permease [Candidatus Angelobacter sp.]